MEEVATDEAKYQKLNQSLLGYELIMDSWTACTETWTTKEQKNITQAEKDAYI